MTNSRHWSFETRINAEMESQGIDGYAIWVGGKAEYENDWIIDVENLDDHKARILAAILQGVNTIDIHIHGSSLTPQGIRQLSGLEGVRSLEVSDCPGLSDDSLQFGGFRELRALYLWDLHLTEPGLEKLKALRQLHHLTVDCDGVTRRQLEELRASLPNTRLSDSINGDY
jgi:hypothetical protein